MRATAETGVANAVTNVAGSDMKALSGRISFVAASKIEKGREGSGQLTWSINLLPDRAWAYSLAPAQSPMRPVNRAGRATQSLDQGRRTGFAHGELGGPRTAACFWFLWLVEAERREHQLLTYRICCANPLLLVSVRRRPS